MNETALQKSILIGGYLGFQNLTLQNTAGLLATGRGSLYTHGSAISAGTASADQAIWQAFAPYGGGILEVGQGSFFDHGNAYDTYCVPVDYVPQEITVDLSAQVSGFTTANLATLETWMNAIRARSELSEVVISPFATPGGTDNATTNPLTGENGHVFSTTDSFWGPLAQACLYGGGIALDLPAGSFDNLGDGWPQFIESEIKWGNANGIRTSVVFSPTTDGTFVQDVQKAVAKLVAAGAIPTDYSVENYGSGDAGLVAAGQSETTPESLNAAALWLADNAPVTTIASSASGTTAGSGSDTLTLAVSEDAYQGDARFTVTVDGTQVGGTFTATASHASGASEQFTLSGNWGSGQHMVAIDFLNDAYGGTAATDRNLYVGTVSYDGTSRDVDLSLLSAGTQSITVGTTPTVTGAAGQTITTTANSATVVELGAGTETLYSLGDDTISAGSGGSTIHAGAGNVSITGGTGGMSFIGGSGSATISLDEGTANTLTFGTGSSTVEGGGTNTISIGTGTVTLDLTGGGYDTVSGFKLGTDHVDLASGQTASVHHESWGTLVSLSDGSEIALLGVQGHASTIIG